MRIAMVMLVLVSLLGTATGIGISYYRFSNGADVYGFDKPISSSSAGPVRLNQAKRRPRLVVEGDDTFDFGIMSRNERRSHDFQIHNHGDAPLVIRFLDKTCQCTDIAISKPQIPPEESGTITLTWQPSSFNPEFEQTARFQTNDPGRIELDLTVKGKVQQVVQASPREVNVNNMSLTEGRDVSFNVFGYRDADLEITKLVWLNPEIQEFFEADYRALEPTELEAETGALAGFQVNITVKPGLEPGRFDQTLRVQLNKEDLGPKDVPIRGSVVGNIRIGGRGYDGRKQLWDLGTLPGSEIHERELWVFVTGDNKAEVEMKIKSLEPDDVLEAEIQPPKDASKVARHTLVLQIRPQTGVVNRLGYQQGDLGEIVLETTDPTAPEIRIPVAFAVESAP